MTRKVGDIIEFVIRIEIIIPDGEEPQGALQVDDYKREYKVSYTVNDNEEYHEYFLDAEEGTSPVEDDIKNYINEIIPLEFKEIAEYEIIDLYDQEYDFQSAKVRVKAVR